MAVAWSHLVLMVRLHSRVSILLDDLAIILIPSLRPASMLPLINARKGSALIHKPPFPPQSSQLTQLFTQLFGSYMLCRTLSISFPFCETSFSFPSICGNMVVVSPNKNMFDFFTTRALVHSWFSYTTLVIFIFQKTSICTCSKKLEMTSIGWKDQCHCPI